MSDIVDEEAENIPPQGHARIVYLARNPEETIPSLLKLMRGGWKALGWDEAKQQKTLQILVDQSFHTYMHPIEALDAHPEIRGAVVDYRDLTADPAATIEGVYRDLELPMTDAFREELSKQGKRARDHKTDHEYSLEEFGLEADVIRERLGVLFDRFGWDEAGGEGASGDEGPSSRGESVSA